MEFSPPGAPLGSPRVMRIFLEGPERRVVGRVDHRGAVIAPSILGPAEGFPVGGLSRLQQRHGFRGAGRRRDEGVIPPDEFGGSTSR